MYFLFAAAFTPAFFPLSRKMIIRSFSTPVLLAFVFLARFLQP